MTNPYSIGLTQDELEEFLLHQYNAITSLYFQYDSIALTKIIEDLWDDWVKRKKPELWNMIVVSKQSEVET